MQMKVPSKAPINPTKSLKNGIASAMRKEMIQLNSTHELIISRWSCFSMVGDIQPDGIVSWSVFR